MVLDAPLTVQPRAASPVSFAPRGGINYQSQVNRAATNFLHDFSSPAIPSLNNSSTIPLQYTHTITACSPPYNIPLQGIDRLEHTGLEVSNPLANIGNKPRTTVTEVRFASPLTQAYSPAHVPTATPESVSALKTEVTPFKSNNNALIGPSAPIQKNTLKPQKKEEEKKVVPKPALHPKTIAFGKTVNVSQTVEGTSRAAKAIKRLPSMNRVPIIRENKENEKSTSEDKEEMMVVNAGRKEYDLIPFEDLHRQLTELRAKDEERTREIKRLEEKDEERAKQIEKLRQRDCDRSDQLLKLTTLVNDLARKQSQQLRTTPVKRRDTSPCLAVVPSPARVQKDREIPVRQTQIKEKTGGLLETNLEVLQRRLQEDPLFRQTILDVLADEADKPQNNLFEKNTSCLARSKRETLPTARESRDSQSPAEGGTFTKNTRTARTPINQSRPYVCQSPQRDRMPTFTQKVTVERKYHGSARFGTNYSVDTKKFLEENILIPESIISNTAAPAASVYQPGESVTYYPPSNDKTNKARYTVESPVEDEDCDFNDVIRTPRHEDPVGRRERLDRVRERRMARKMRGTVNDTDF